MKLKKVNLSKKLNLFNEKWSPKIVGKLNQQLVKVAKFEGVFTNHKHENEDEFFLVLKGTIFIELAQGTIEINQGEFLIIPKGTMHKPYAKEEAHVLLFEPETTLNTGDKNNLFTVKDLPTI